MDGRLKVRDHLSVEMFSAGGVDRVTGWHPGKDKTQTGR